VEGKVLKQKEQQEGERMRGYSQGNEGRSAWLGYNDGGDDGGTWLGFAGHNKSLGCLQ